MGFSTFSRYCGAAKTPPLGFAAYLLRKCMIDIRLARHDRGNNDIVNKLADEFNASRPNISIPTSRAAIPTTMIAGMPAYPGRQLTPHHLCSTSVRPR